jgi:hypothetical protein
MLANTSTFLRQIFPPVVATLIAALLIAGFNRAFSTHLTQPRMAAMDSGTAEPERPRARPMPVMTEMKPAVFAAAIEERPRPRLWDKDTEREAAKDAGTKVAEVSPAAVPAAVAAAPAAPTAQPQSAGLEPARAALRKPELRHAEQPRHVEVRPVEPRQVEPRQAEPRQADPRIVMAPPAPAQPHPMAVPASPPPVIVAAPAAAGMPAGNPNEAPMVTVPDRPRAMSQRQQPYPMDPQQDGEQAQQQPGPPQGPLGTFVNAMKPSNWFARAREFGERVEAAGNDILPTIRQ